MPNNEATPLKIAAVQAAPVFLDRAATVQKACALIEAAARNGARLIAFPEAFIPAYPDWVWKIPPREHSFLNELYAELLAQSVSIPSETTGALCRAAKRANAYVVMGLNERNSEASNASLYNTLLYIGPEGNILGKHRKLVPTSSERMVWGAGDGSTLQVYDTPFAKVGGLICWENYMPLARYAMYAWGTQIYVAPTWDSGETWLATLRHIAKEGRVYVIGCCIAMRASDIPDRFDFKNKFYSGRDEWINTGDSAIVHPSGNFMAGPVSKKEEILYAEVNIQQMNGLRRVLDVAGHYARPDVFELIVHTNPRPLVKTALPPSAAQPNDAEQDTTVRN
jgi:nitrilase